jgi:hypothetical protein
MLPRLNPISYEKPTRSYSFKIDIANEDTNVDNLNDRLHLVTQSAKNSAGYIVMTVVQEKFTSKPKESPSS